VSATRRLLVLLSAGAWVGCQTDPVEHICPDVAYGELVITEVRGDQDPDDSLGQWIEIYNASGLEQDLIGLHLRLRTLDGSSDDRIIIRRSVPIAADGYAVIGLGPDDARPDGVDYGAGADAGTAMFSIGVIDLDGCDDTLDDTVYADRLQYSNGLPGLGTYSLGTAPPTADGNDMLVNWCTNLTPAGTPGVANPPCP
jgi:hypothetical protein